MNKFFAFHSDWPCLTKQTLHVAWSFQAIRMVLLVDVRERVGSLGWSACAHAARIATRRAIAAELPGGWWLRAFVAALRVLLMQLGIERQECSEERCTLIAAWE